MALDIALKTGVRPRSVRSHFCFKCVDCGRRGLGSQADVIQTVQQTVLLEGIHLESHRPAIGSGDRDTNSGCDVTSVLAEGWSIDIGVEVGAFRRRDGCSRNFFTL